MALSNPERPRPAPRPGAVTSPSVPTPAPAVPLVRVAVLNWNGADHLARCLDALCALDWPPERLDLVVVDNASTDGSDGLVAGYPRVRLVRNDHNGGFVANNLALRDLDGVDYVGLVNADSFVEPGWVAALVEALAADEGLGAVSARLVFDDRFVEVAVDSPTFRPPGPDPRELGVMVSGLRVDGVDRWRDAQVAAGAWGIEHLPDGTIFQWTSDHATVRVPVGTGDTLPARVEVALAAETAKRVTLRSGGGEATVDVGPARGWYDVPVGGTPIDVVNNVGSVLIEGGYGADRGFLEPDAGQYDAPAEVFAWCGGSVLFRPAYLADVGLFDERFFLYYEDTDLSWRGRSRGWRYRYVPGAVARHVHAASTGEGSPTFQHYVERNRLLMLVKNAPAPMAANAVWRYLLTTLSYARRDLVAPLLGLQRPRPMTVVRRLRSFVDFLRLAPATLAERRRVRRRATVADGELLAWAVRR
ncbi:MAG TPA: glycosyltransferase [Acidimicrobiales bacterium]|nr:glycosyltransferase [Acidimicrobiales bacterium]